MIGSRYIQEGHLKKRQPFYRILGARFLNFMVRLMVGLKIKDTQCGFKLFSEKSAIDIFHRLTFKRFSFDVEVLSIANFLGYNIKEVPVDWYARGEGTVSPIRDGLRFLKALIIIRMNLWRKLYRNISRKSQEV